MIFLDTSLLAKLYVPEAGSRELEDQIGEEQHIVLSEVARVEFAFAVAHLVRENALSRARSRTLLRRFREDWATYTRVAVEDRVLDRAEALLSRHPLRSLDAIHLASALIVDDRHPGTLRFGTADGRQADAAAAESLRTL